MMVIMSRKCLKSMEKLNFFTVLVNYKMMKPTRKIGTVSPQKAVLDIQHLCCHLTPGSCQCRLWKAMVIAQVIELHHPYGTPGFSFQLTTSAHHLP